MATFSPILSSRTTLHIQKYKFFNHMRLEVLAVMKIPVNFLGCDTM